MNAAFQRIRHGDAPILIISDHASNHVPEDIDLGIAPELLTQHVALDIGAAEVSALLAERLGCTAILGGISRLVCDLNREEGVLNIIPHITDGHVIPGNEHADHAARLARFHQPYHAEVARQVAAIARPFILSVHSFTPCLATHPDQKRPWEIGVLYNEDDRAARIAIPMLEACPPIVPAPPPMAATWPAHAASGAPPA
jgi:predicted N-formylglutamate amidohydrolase